MSSKKLAPLYEHPFDAFLLKKSALYRQSRKLFLSKKGSFRPTLLSPARALGSASLLKNEIEYSPLGRELSWSESDRIQRKDVHHLGLISSWNTDVFHEQNHRILWHHFRSSDIFFPPTQAAACRLLNLTECLVIILDMALGDEIEARLALSLYQVRGIYNSGSAFMRKMKRGSRAYRNALQICLHTTFLRLEGMHIEDIPHHVRTVFSNIDGSVVDQCIKRALKIEPRFVELTNPMWQKKHVNKVIDAFAPPRGKEPLILPTKAPLHHVEAYLIAEKWLDKFLL